RHDVSRCEDQPSEILAGHEFFVSKSIQLYWFYTGVCVINAGIVFTSIVVANCVAKTPARVACPRVRVSCLVAFCFHMWLPSSASLRSLTRESVVSAVQRLRDEVVDGVVVIAPQRAAVDALLHLPPEVPVVAVEAGPDNSVPVVAVDQHAGAAAATRHLLELGHRHIWHIAGPQDWLEAEQRIEGWRSALRAAGAAQPPLLRGDWSARSGCGVGEHLLAEAGVTAVFVADDQL